MSTKLSLPEINLELTKEEKDKAKKEHEKRLAKPNKEVKK